MSLLDKSASKTQLIDIFNSMKFPIMGAGGGFAPIGTLNFYDGTVAPQGWLICDGSTYNIADYPELASHYASHHGASNYWGGDGITTFAVPDLRGEFIRGAGTNSHANQGNGGAVGEHQDGTEIPDVFISSQNNSLLGGSSATNYDNRITDGRRYTITNGTYSSTDNQKRFTSRPTNTSFLICVKATVSGDANGHVYSTDEQIVGTTPDGKTLYEKTYEGTITPTSAQGTNTYTLIENDPNKVCYRLEGNFASPNQLGVSSPFPYFGGNLTHCIRIGKTNLSNDPNNAFLYIYNSIISTDNNATYSVTMKYTKKS